MPRGGVPRGLFRHVTAIHVTTAGHPTIRITTAGHNRVRTNRLGAARVGITAPSRAPAAVILARSHVPGQLPAHLRFGGPLPPHPVLLTFDDASAGQYTAALRILRRHRFTATFFVMTVVLDQPHWLSRAQVRDLHRQGMTIGSHTWDHHPVTRYAGADWRTQLTGPAHELARTTGDRRTALKNRTEDRRSDSPSRPYHSEPAWVSGERRGATVFSKESSVRRPVDVGVDRLPPGDRGSWPGFFDPSRARAGERAAVTEPTQNLPVVAAPRSGKPPPNVAARAVIVYRDTPRRPWRLPVFTAVIVSLTIGVVLGQSIAFEPTYRSTANAQTAVAPPVSSPSAAVQQPWPDAEHRATAPLAAARTRVLEVVGPSAVLNVRSVDLGETLVDVATTDPSAVPTLTDTGKVSRLELIPTGTVGTVGATVQLNAKVAWTLRLTGGSLTQDIDMRAGGMAGLAIAGDTAHLVLQLPKPKGTVRVSLSGPVGELTVGTKGGTPVRLRLKAGAGTALVDGKTRRKVKAGTALTPATWRAARNRYDLAAAGAVTSVRTTTN